MDKIIAPIIGGVLGIAIAGYFLVYAPMQENIKRNGCPFLVCAPTQPAGKENG